MTPLTKDLIADEFLAAAEAAGLKKVFVLVGQMDHNEFVVTMTLSNPVAVGYDDELIVSSCPYEFEDAKEVRQSAAAKARMFAQAIPTIH